MGTRQEAEAAVRAVPGAFGVIVQVYANAASEVWERRYRELLDLAYRHPSIEGCEACITELRHMAKEVLEDE